MSPVSLLTLILSAVIWESPCLTRTLPEATTHPPSSALKVSAEMSIGPDDFAGAPKLGKAMSADAVIATVAASATAR